MIKICADSLDLAFKKSSLKPFLAPYSLYSHFGKSKGYLRRLIKDTNVQ